MIGASNVSGMLMVWAGTTTFGLIAVLVKLVQESMPTHMLLEFRFGCQFAIGVAGCLLKGLRPWAASADRKWLVLWGMNYWLFSMFYYEALQQLPLGDAITLVYLGPVFGSMMARMVLRDPLPWTFLPCTLLAITGSAMVAKPSFLFGGRSDLTALGFMYAVGAAFFSGNIGVISRMPTPGRHWLEVPTVGLGFGALLLTPTTLLVDSLEGNAAQYTSIPWTPRLLAFTACVGVGGFLAIVLVTEGYRRAHYAVAAMLAYCEIPFCYFLQWLVWGSQVTVLGAAGAALVVVAMATSSLLNRKRKAADDETERLAEHAASSAEDLEKPLLDQVKPEEDSALRGG